MQKTEGTRVGLGDPCSWYEPYGTSELRGLNELKGLANFDDVVFEEILVTLLHNSWDHKTLSFLAIPRVSMTEQHR